MMWGEEVTLAFRGWFFVVVVWLVFFSPSAFSSIVLAHLFLWLTVNQVQKFSQNINIILICFSAELVLQMGTVCICATTVPLQR